MLPIISYGAVGNVTDLIYLKGVDFAITYADVLDHFKNVEKIPGIERRVNYVIPMFQGDFHLYVRPEIKTIQDLAGKKVSFNTVGSAANYTGDIVFDRLGVKAEKIFMNNALALEAMLVDTASTGVSMPAAASGGVPGEATWACTGVPWACSAVSP